MLEHDRWHFFATPPAIYPAFHEPIGYLRREEDMIKPHSLVSQPPLVLIIPKRPERPSANLWLPSGPNRMDLSKRISPINHVCRGVPPVLAIHGDADDVVTLMR